MPGTTTKGVPYILGTDAAADIDTEMQLLAEWVDVNPGIAVVTTVERDAFTATEEWLHRFIYNTTSGSLERYNGAGWVSVVPWGTAWGVMGRSERKTFHPITQATADVPELTTTFTAVSGRLYKTSVALPWVQSTAGGVATALIYLTTGSGTILMTANETFPVVNTRATMSFFLYESGLSGSTTRKIRAVFTSYDGRIDAGSTNPAQIIVEDIGPS